jgi:hypothetical protein
MHAEGIQAYGVDPSFNTHSGLYRSDSYQRSWHFFNSSENSAELSTTRAPFAFFPRSARGYRDGFPVFFPVLAQPPLPVSHFCHALHGTLRHELCIFSGYGLVCAGARVSCYSEEDAAAHEGCSLPGPPH